MVLEGMEATYGGKVEKVGSLVAPIYLGPEDAADLMMKCDPFPSLILVQDVYFATFLNAGP